MRRKVARDLQPTTELPARPIRSRHGGLVWVAAVAVVASAAVFAYGHPLNHDVGWFVSVARRLLAGEHLYTRIIEVNPPLIMYLMVPAVLLADGAGMSDQAALNAVVIGLVLLSIAISTRLLMSSDRSATESAAWAALLAFALLIVPGADFGQREHLLVILSVPFVITGWRRRLGVDVSAREGWLTGLLAGAGFALKPHFLLIWAALEAWNVLGTRPCLRLRAIRRRSETVAVAVFLALYAAAVGLWFPEYFALMGRIAGVYQSYWPQSGIGLVAVLYALPLTLLFLAVGLRGIARPGERLGATWLVFAAAGLLMAALQAKGWSYHFLPALVAMVIGGTIVAAASAGAWARSTSSARLRLMMSLAFCVLAFYPVSVMVWKSTLAHELQREIWTDRVETLAPYRPDSVFVFGDLVDDAYPLLNYLPARSASPFASMWWLAAAYEGGESTPRLNDAAFTEAGAVERDFFRRTVVSFSEHRPDLVLVDTATHGRFGGQAFPYVAYFSRDSAFAAAWASYARVGAMDRYVIMSRAPAAEGEQRGPEREP